MEIEKKYFTIKELAKYTGVSAKTLYDWTGQRVIPSIKIGKRILVDIIDFNALMEKLKRKATDRSKRILRELYGDT